MPFWTLIAHLDVPARSTAARAVRATVAALERDGLLARASSHGVPVWSLSDAGAAHLRRARRSGGELPESPQHRAWRRARTCADQEIERFRRSLAVSLNDAARLLEVEPPAHSDAWLELGRRLALDCRRLGSASHCLYEWREPSEDRADVDDRREPADASLPFARRESLRFLRAGRRNVLLWDGGAGR